MRRGRDGGRKKKLEKKEKTDDYSGSYVIASSRPPERRWLETLYARANFLTFAKLSLSPSLSGLS